MKFINYLESITGISIYPLLSLLIFFGFFTAMTIWAFKADRKYIALMKSLPFPENEND
jgi:cytochrome c oxidase cbb3-type subunit 4